MQLRTCNWLLLHSQSEQRNKGFWNGQGIVRITWPGFCTSEVQDVSSVTEQPLSEAPLYWLLSQWSQKAYGDIWGGIRASVQLRWRHQYLNVIAQLQQPNATDIPNCWFMSHKGSMESKHLGQVCFFNFFPLLSSYVQSQEMIQSQPEEWNWVFVGRLSILKQTQV